MSFTTVASAMRSWRSRPDAAGLVAGEHLGDLRGDQVVDGVAVELDLAPGDRVALLDLAGERREGAVVEREALLGHRPSLVRTCPVGTPGAGTARLASPGVRTARATRTRDAAPRRPGGRRGASGHRSPGRRRRDRSLPGSESSYPIRFGTITRMRCILSSSMIGAPHSAQVQSSSGPSGFFALNGWRFSPELVVRRDIGVVEECHMGRRLPGHGLADRAMAGVIVDRVMIRLGMDVLATTRQLAGHVSPLP